MHDRDLQDILRNMDDNEIAVLLKGKSEEIRKHLLSCVSERKRTSIIREEQILGAMLRRDVDRTTREFLENLRQKEKDGKIVLLRPGETLV
jgi:flagellar motor switch protein FliG